MAWLPYSAFYPVKRLHIVAHFHMPISTSKIGGHCVGHRFSKALVIEGKLTLGTHLHMEWVWYVFSNILSIFSA